ncbi:hypothetical protein [Bacillus sp. V59.32b]|uniref:hypothetical protein n=1 Tax=Bacillus sp. V59.32b TaxID=1758642 RepID=UPI000E3C54C8|nr:hypothetical protein [Bacillus sp. V59.32b]RFU69310.1 hypothetical protein D0463_02770 [Bacillus sp. V59.32b]
MKKEHFWGQNAIFFIIAFICIYYRQPATFIYLVLIPHLIIISFRKRDGLFRVVLNKMFKRRRKNHLNIWHKKPSSESEELVQYEFVIPGQHTFSFLADHEEHNFFNQEPLYVLEVLDGSPFKETAMSLVEERSGFYLNGDWIEYESK